MKIIPETDAYSGVTGAKRLVYNYLHGKLQDDVGFDVFGIIDWDLIREKHENTSYIDDALIPEGLYKCTFENKPCTLFHWKANISGGGNSRGFVVYDDDVEGVTYAKKCFDEKRSCI